MITASKIFNPLWEDMKPREKEVLMGRFGLDKFDEPQTLASLGENYGITRERVRQIEAAGLTALKAKIKETPACLEVIEKSKKFLKNAGGLARKELFLENQEPFVKNLTENHIALLIEASDAFYHHPDDDEYWHFYYLDREVLRAAVNFINGWLNYLKARRDLILAGHYYEQLAKFIEERDVNRPYADNYLSVSKKIAKGPFGDIGFSEWPEVNPKTIRDHAYLVLKKKKKPLHFEEIAEIVSEMKRRGTTAVTSPYEPSVHTVHNELIKDDRFVLVGRGTYGLREHGYQPGTAREVLERILKKGGPMRPREAVLAVQKERFFKPNTVLANLQNREFFERLKDGTYRVRRDRLF